MLKRSYQALVSCSYSLSCGLLSGALLLSSAWAQSSEQDLAPSVSEAAVHALSQNSERSAQGKVSPVVAAGSEDEETSQTPSLLDAVHSNNASAPDSNNPQATNSDKGESAFSATANSSKSQVSKAQVSDSQVPNAQVSKIQVSETQEQGTNDSQSQTVNTQSTPVNNEQVSKSQVSEAPASDASAGETVGSQTTEQVATTTTGETSTVTDGHPIESAGQNKFGAFRNSQTQTQGKGPLAEGLHTPGGIFQWMLSTVGVLLLIFVLAYVFRKTRFMQKSVGTMQVEGQIALGQKERLMRVKVGDRSLLLGVTPNSVNLVMDLGVSGANKGSQVGTDESSTLESTAQNAEVNTPYSAAYKSAQEAYSRKHYEDILVSLSQVAASAAASAAISAVRGEGEMRFAPSAPSASSSAQTSYNASQEGQASAVEGEDKAKIPVQAEQDTTYKAQEAQDSESRAKARKESAPKYVKEPFQAIVEPHANEAHHIANHFSSEHTIVRASNSTPFMGAQFGLPPDKEVLHARAQRSKQYAQELEQEGRPRLGSEEFQGQGDGTQGQFGEYLDSAMTDLKNRRGRSTMVDTQPWVAEDDLAQELEQRNRRY